MSQPLTEQEWEEQKNARDFKDAALLLLLFPLLAFICFFVWNVDAYRILMEADIFIMFMLSVAAYFLQFLAFFFVSLLTESSMSNNLLRKRTNQLIYISIFTTIPATILFLFPVIIELTFKAATGLILV